MFRVLLVDDENFICKGLKAMIERANTNFTHIEECFNGKDALDLITHKRFDLVITDIRMPIMDGLELMRNVHTFKNKPHFVVLSGYDEFSYAKEALKYGAKDYLLKPIKRNELTDVLRKVEEVIQQEEDVLLNKRKLDDLESMQWEYKLKEFLFGEHHLHQDFSDILNNSKLDMLKKQYYVCVMASRSNLQNHSLILKSYAGKFFKEDAYLIDNENYVVLFIDASADLTAFAQFLQLNGEVELNIGISEVMNTFSDIKKAYLQAREALKYRLLREAGEVIHYLQTTQLRTDFIMPLQQIKRLAELLGSDRLKEIEGILDELFNAETLSLYNINYTRKLAESVYQHAVQDIVDQITRKAPMLDKPYEELREILSFGSLSDYVQALKKHIFEINEILLTLRDMYKSKNEIDRAIRFIEKNYHKDLTMTVVANYVSLNYTYFCSLFKEKTGMSFVDYLKNVRIEKSKDLLKSSEYKIGEISKKVGYLNTKQFTKTFRAIVGISPLEYRQKVI